MKSFVDFFKSFDLVQSIVLAVIGIVIVVADVFLIPPMTISTVVLGGLLTVTGIIGIILNATEKK